MGLKKTKASTTREQRFIHTVWRQGGPPLRGPTLLLVSRVLTAGIGPLIWLWVVRYLGAETYGLYASAAAVTGLVSVLSDFGVQQATLKLATQPNVRIGGVISVASRVVMLYSALAAGVAVAWVLLVPSYERPVVILSVILVTGFPAGPLRSLLMAGLQVRGEYDRVAWWSLLSSTLQWFGVLATALLKADVFVFALTYVATSWLSSFVVWLNEGRRLQVNIAASGDSPSTRAFMRESWVFGVSVVMYQLYHRAPLAILSAMRPPLEVGYYSLVFRGIELIYVLPTVMFNEVLFARYFVWRVAQRERFALYYRLMTRLMGFIGLLIVSWAGLFAREALTFILGEPSILADRLLRIMIWAVPARFLASSAGGVLLTDGQMKPRIRNQTIMAAVSVLFNLILVPLLGTIASALIMVVTEIGMFGLHSHVVRRSSEFRLGIDTKTAVALAIAALLPMIVDRIEVSLSIWGRFLVAAGLAAAVGGLAVVTAHPDERAELRYMLGHRVSVGGTW